MVKIIRPPTANGADAGERQGAAPHQPTHPRLDPKIRDALWDGLPEINSLREAGRFAEDIYAYARLSETPGSRRAIILGDTHNVIGELAVIVELIRRAPREGIDRYLVECSPAVGQGLLGVLPHVRRRMRAAGALRHYLGSLPDELIWGALPALAMTAALDAGLKVGFIDADSDDPAERNDAMASGIRRYVDGGENVLAVMGCDHVPAVHRAIDRDIPGRVKVNAISAQVVAPVSPSARHLVESNLRHPPPPGRGFVYRLGAAMMETVPRGAGGGCRRPFRAPAAPRNSPSHPGGKTHDAR